MDSLPGHQVLWIFFATRPEDDLPGQLSTLAQKLHPATSQLTPAGGLIAVARTLMHGNLIRGQYNSLLEIDVEELGQGFELWIIPLLAWINADGVGPAIAAIIVGVVGMLIIVWSAAETLRELAFIRRVKSWWAAVAWYLNRGFFANSVCIFPVSRLVQESRPHATRTPSLTAR